MLCCNSTRSTVTANAKNELSPQQTVRITAIVLVMLSTLCLGSAYILKGTSILPYQYISGFAQLLLGLSALCAQTLALFYISLSIFTWGLSFFASPEKESLKKDNAPLLVLPPVEQNGGCIAPIPLELP